MSYSCSAAAMDTLQEVIAQQGSDIRNTSNGWIYKGKTYFYDIGRENSDGAITGRVYRMNEDGSTNNGVGFRINPNGSIARFPSIRRTIT